MKLLNRPELVYEPVTIRVAGSISRLPGRPKNTNVNILWPSENSKIKEDVWNKLKYGVHLKIGVKVPEITFHETHNDIILYGVVPVGVLSSDIQEGQIFECHVDYYEVKPHE